MISCDVNWEVEVFLLAEIYTHVVWYGAKDIELERVILEWDCKTKGSDIY